MRKLFTAIILISSLSIQGQTTLDDIFSVVTIMDNRVIELCDKLEVVRTQNVGIKNRLEILRQRQDSIFNMLAFDIDDVVPVVFEGLSLSHIDAGNHLQDALNAASSIANIKLQSNYFLERENYTEYGYEYIKNDPSLLPLGFPLVDQDMMGNPIDSLPFPRFEKSIRRIYHAWKWSVLPGSQLNYTKGDFGQNF